MPRNKMNRNNFNIRATQKLGSIINMDVSVNYTATKSDNPLPNGGNSNPLFAFVYNGIGAQILIIGSIIILTLRSVEENQEE